MSNCGIYAFYSKTQARVYIGQSRNIKRRYRQHELALLNGSHDNDFLQNHVNKYGFADLEFLRLVKCSQEELTANEVQQVMNHEQLGFELFNIVWPKDSPTNNTLWAERIRVIHATPEVKAKMCAASSNRALTRTTKSGWAAPARAVIINGNGLVEFEFPSLAEAARQLGVHPGNLRSVVLKTRPRVGGYTARYTDELPST